MSEEILYKDGLVFHHQGRKVGDKIYWMRKIRTMPKGSHELYRLFVTENGMDHTGHVDCDPRITYIGRFLRRWWIDELPQLYDLLDGRMMVMGLRLLLPEDFEEMPDDLIKARERHLPALINCCYGPDFTKLRDGIRIRDWDRKFNHWDAERNWVESYEENPMITQREYIRAFFHNVRYEGLRGR